MDKIIVAILGIFGIVFTYWFFLMKKEKEVEAVSSIDITVKGGYDPETISVPVNKTTTLNFIRSDSNACLEEVVLPDFKVRKYLPMNEKISIPITPKKTGQYEISCGMNMFHGKVIVK